MKVALALERLINSTKGPPGGGPTKLSIPLIELVLEIYARGKFAIGIKKNAYKE